MKYAPDSYIKKHVCKDTLMYTRESICNIAYRWGNFFRYITKRSLHGHWARSGSCTKLLSASKRKSSSSGWFFLSFFYDGICSFIILNSPSLSYGKAITTIIWAAWHYVPLIFCKNKTKQNKTKNATFS